MNSEERDDQLGSTVRLDSKSVRGLAHPLRVKILGLLRTEGSATATMVAQQLALNSGATSYHLRQLATYGFVVEDTARGVGRERWWRAAHAATQWDNEDLEVEGAGEAMLRSIAPIYAERIQSAADQYGTLPGQWQRASTMSDFVLRLTAEESEQLGEELLEVLQRYRRQDPENVEAAPADSIPVSVQYQVIPHGHALPVAADEGGHPADSGGGQ
ncbi:MAG TPA: helix-turn-helix domain-containing protein [Beutenbergiaceae bacterium]|nr:helix-turn-helix domain-containing protein [Beutenbergiaceae bacterium]